MPATQTRVPSAAALADHRGAGIAVGEWLEIAPDRDARSHA
jgi:hypothetical protein